MSSNIVRPTYKTNITLGQVVVTGDYYFVYKNLWPVSSYVCPPSFCPQGREHITGITSVQEVKAYIEGWKTSVGEMWYAKPNDIFMVLDKTWRAAKDYHGVSAGKRLWIKVLHENRVGWMLYELHADLRQQTL